MYKAAFRNQTVAVKVFTQKVASINNTTPNHLIRQEVYTIKLTVNQLSYKFSLSLSLSLSLFLASPSLPIGANFKPTPASIHHLFGGSVHETQSHAVARVC